jgi:predicted cupin superfamily sugar epimerase
VSIHVIDDDGAYTRLSLGPDHTRGQLPQQIVPARRWFGATVDETSSYALVGCTVAPGFDFADFELARRDEMLRAFPQHEDLIVRLTNGPGDTP